MSNETEWVLVPREPSEAMLSAAHYELADKPFSNNAERSARAYAAMLAAAPQPPAEAQAQGGGEASEGWHAALDSASELVSNSPDARYRKRAEQVRDWIKANRPAPPSAPVGVDAKVLARDVHYAIRDAGLAPESPADDAAMRDAILAVLAQQPAAIPRLANCGQYMAFDHTGQHYYLNHANTWQTFQGQQPAAVDEADAKDAEIERLRAERDTVVNEAAKYAERSGRAQAEVDHLRRGNKRLAEALRELCNVIDGHEVHVAVEGKAAHARAALRDHDQEGTNDR